MTDARRKLLLLLASLLLVSGVGVAAVERDRPGVRVAAAESPILQVAPTTTVPPTTEPPTTAPPETTTTIEEPVVAATTERLKGGAVAPPRNAYAPEPIQEIGRIQIPKIGLDHRMMNGISLRNIDLGPSHWPGTPMPGEQGNTVVAGHRVTHSHPFRRINELVAGDEIIFTVGDVRSRYVVTGYEVVAPSRVDIVDPTPTPTATLFACHPPGSARQRYVVRAALQPPEPVGDPLEATTAG